MQRKPLSNLPDCYDSSRNHLEYTQALIDSYIPDSHCCERCGRRIWASRQAGSYERGFIYPENGKPVYETIRIPLVLCKDCGKSSDGPVRESGNYKHAILPQTIIPFTAYSLLFILTVLADYVNRTCTVEDVCAHWHIAVSTLYAWKKRYMEHYDAWAVSIDNPHLQTDNPLSGSDSSDPQRIRNAVNSTLNQIRFSLPSIVSSFFRRFGFSFLQPNRKTHFREIPGSRRARI